MVVLVAIVAVAVVSVIAVASVISVLPISIAAQATPVASVLAVASVTVIVAVLLLGHIDSVQHHCHVRQLLLVGQCVDQLEVRLWRIVGTAHIDGGVGHTGNLKRVGYQSDWSRINHDVIVLILQGFDDCLK